MNTPVLRQWREADFEPLAEMCADADVMRYFLAPLTRDETRAMLDRMRAAIEQRGWGIWAVEVDGDLAGMVGLNVPRWPLPCSPCTEVLWRLRKAYWGRGIAHAAASQAVDYGFAHVGLDEIVAFTTPPNLRSIRLMERLGFARDHAGDFDHPAVPEGHALRRHVLYRKKKVGAVGMVASESEGGGKGIVAEKDAADIRVAEERLGLLKSGKTKLLNRDEAWREVGI